MRQILLMLVRPTDTSEAPREFERRDATEEDMANYRHVPDKLGAPVWIALLVGAAERFAFYCITAPWGKLPVETPENCA